MHEHLRGSPGPLNPPLLPGSFGLLFGFQFSLVLLMVSESGPQFLFGVQVPVLLVRNSP